MVAAAYLVGAGPGAPGLITVRGLQVLARAQVLVYDSACHPALLDHAPEEAERIRVGSWPDGRRMPQAQINALLVERARAGLTVVRLKNGDPLTFGRGGEEAEALAEAGLTFEIVPGVSAGVAAAALAAIPVTQKGLSSAVSYAIVQPGSPAPCELERLAERGSTLVLYLEPASIRSIADALIEGGRPRATPVAVVEAASTPGQKVFAGALEDIAERAGAARAPLVMIVGQAVSLRERLAWREKRPLHGRTVVVTRARAQAGEMVSGLEELGAEVLLAPCIETVAPPSWALLDEAIERIGEYDWLVLTSANGVEAFLSRLRERGRDLRALGGVRIAAVGPATAGCLRAAYLEPDLVAEVFNAAALADGFAGMGVGGKRFLIVRALAGREALPEALRALGASVTVAPAYQTVCPATDPEPVRRRFTEGRLSAVTFASPSAVRGFVRLLGEHEAREVLARTPIAVIGPTTREAVEQLGLRAAVVAGEATARSLVEALAAYLGNSPVT
ncbi:MAG: uroporphyrinogen-III C-methyltransferase [Myxococcales bacterium]|jgi:uroporphyrinogen III methyltransferase/synthase